MDHGKSLLGRRNVIPGVEALISDIQVEGTFPNGYGEVGSVLEDTNTPSQSVPRDCP